MRQITKLLHPFPRKYVHTNPSGGGDYVSHYIVEQRLLYVLGVPPTTKVVQVIRGDVAAKKSEQQDLRDACVGVILRMTAVIDGALVEVEEVGDCEDPHFWKTDGARLKDAFSDAYKRCAMRLGVALHIWAQDEFYVGEKLLSEDQEEAAAEPPAVTEQGQEPGPAGEEDASAGPGLLEEVPA